MRYLCTISIECIFLCPQNTWPLFIYMPHKEALFKLINFVFVCALTITYTVICPIYIIQLYAPGHKAGVCNRMLVYSSFYI